MKTIHPNMLYFEQCAKIIKYAEEEIDEANKLER